MTLDAYVETFLERIEQTRKPTTHADHRKILDRYVFPVFRGQDLQQVTREAGISKPSIGLIRQHYSQILQPRRNQRRRSPDQYLQIS